MQTRPNTKTLMALFGLAATTKADFNGMTAVQCLSSEFTYILGSDSTDMQTRPYDFTKGGCCEEFGGMMESECKEDCSGNNSVFCIGKDDKLNNRFLKEFLQV